MLVRAGDSFAKGCRGFAAACELFCWKDCGLGDTLPFLDDWVPTGNMRLFGSVLEEEVSGGKGVR